MEAGGHVKRKRSNRIRNVFNLGVGSGGSCVDGQWIHSNGCNGLEGDFILVQLNSHLTHKKVDTWPLSWHLKHAC